MIERPEDSAQPLIAVVDDDASLLRSVARLLRAEGYSVATFGAPGKLLASLPGLKPCCLVVDLHMPEMNGLELHEMLVAQQCCPPTVFITAYDTPQTRDRARQAGGFGLVIKPFDKQELLKPIRAALSAPLYRTSGRTG